MRACGSLVSFIQSVYNADTWAVIALWPTQIGVETTGGEALRIVETDTKIRTEIPREAATAHANDIHRTLPWCAQKYPSRF